MSTHFTNRALIFIIWRKKWDLKKYLKESLSKSQKEIDFALEHYPFSDIDIPRSISVTGVELSQVGEDILVTQSW